MAAAAGLESGHKLASFAAHAAIQDRLKLATRSMERVRLLGKAYHSCIVHQWEQDSLTGEVDLEAESQHVLTSEGVLARDGTRLMPAC